MTLAGKNLTVKAGGRAILDDVSLELAAGELAVIVGPNGAGKSTLLRSLSGEAKLATGSVSLNGRKLNAWNTDAQALQRAVLPQSPTLAFPFRVCDVVELGRYPHRGLANPQDHRAAIDGAMAAADVTHLALRDCRTLSGGELHRVHFARALAQVWSPLADGRTRHLLLDEPTSSLDLSHQGMVLARAKTFANEGGAVLAILHDLNLAAAFADRILVMHNARIAAEGKPADVLTVDLLRKVWGVEGKVVGGDRGEPLTIIVKHNSASPERTAHLRAAE
jgi:iron complex transport system ATP-binding protein